MKHQCKITVLETKVFPDLQKKYLANPQSGPCPCFHAGDEFLFCRDNGRDDYWQLGLNTLTKTTDNPDETAGAPKKPFCSEAWDCISRYVYAALQGGSIMKGWTNDEKMMIACCNDGTRPVVFKIERIDIDDETSSAS